MEDADVGFLFVASDGEILAGVVGGLVVAGAGAFFALLLSRVGKSSS